MKKSGFKIHKRFFPESTNMRLKNPELITQKNTWYYFLAKLLNHIYTQKFISNVKLDKFSYFLSIFIPVPLTVIAVKQK